MCDFQNEVFKAELQKKHITALKEVLINECPDYDENQSKKGISLEAFKALQRILIQKLKQQTCWTILRRFGYDDNLRIKESFYLDSTLNEDEIEKSKNIELSRDAILYLKRLFDG